MRYVLQIQKIPDAAPLPNITVRARRISDGVTLATATTDAEGFVTFAADGHWPPFYLHVADQPGGDKYWRSDECHGAGAISLYEVPIALRALGDGVVRNHLNSLAPSLNGTTLTLDTGTALVAGYPVVNYTLDTFSLTRPVTSTRIDRLVAWVRPAGAASDQGEAGFSVRTGVEGAAVTALVQTADLYEIGLAQVTVPKAGALTLTDERAFAGEKLSDQDVVRLASITTTNGSGDYLTGLIMTLEIPRSGEYKIEATLTGQQLETQIITTWVLQNTYGPTFNGLALSNPGQVATDSTGRILIADTGNNRLVILLSDGTYNSGITGLTGISGVACNAAGDIYVAMTGDWRVYDSTLTLRGSPGAGQNYRHVAAVGNFVFFTGDEHHIEKYQDLGGYLFAGPNVIGTLPAPGSANGQFNDVYGIAASATEVFAVDRGNSRVQVFNASTRAYVRQFPISASARGIALDASGDVLVAEYGQDAVKRYTNTGTFTDSFTQNAPSGIAVATGDVQWVTNAGDGTVAKWDESSTPGGYGQIAIEIDGSVGTYTGIGNRDGAVANADSGTKAGGSTVTIRGFAKATAGTLTLKGLVLSAKATPTR